MRLLSAVFLTCLLTNGLAQNITKPVVKIDVRSGAFNTNLPFDESFTIKGELGYSTRKVVMKYGPVDEKSERAYFKIPKNYTDRQKNSPMVEYSKEYNVKTGETEFAFSEVGPLRPNTPYKFRFFTLSQNTFSANKADFLKRELNRKMVNALVERQIMNIEEMNTVYDDILTAAIGYVDESQLVDANSEPFKIDNYKKDLNLFSYRILSLHNDISRSQALLTRLVDSTGTNSVSSNFNLVLPKLNSINSGTVPLSSYSKRALISVFDKNYQDGRTIGQPLVYLQSYFTDKNLFKRAVLGNSGITSVDDSLNTTDIGTLENLIRITEIVITNEFTKLDNSKVFTGAEVNAFQEILKSLNYILIQRRRMVEANQKLFGLKNEMLDVLVRAYSDDSYVLSSSAEFEVTPKYGPYVSLDLGVLMAYNPYQNSDGRIGNTTYFSVYEGVNIYFSPVNKRIPLSAFKWPYNFYKAFNVHIGLANFSGKYNTYRFQNSFGGLGNPVVGLGLRFNSATKVGLSAMFVNLRDINPTVSRAELVPFLCANLSFDIDVVGAIRRFSQRNEQP